jgi:hypothetical protein
MPDSTMVVVVKNRSTGWLPKIVIPQWNGQLPKFLFQAAPVKEIAAQAATGDLRPRPNRKFTNGPIKNQHIDIITKTQAIFVNHYYSRSAIMVAGRGHNG